MNLFRWFLFPLSILFWLVTSVRNFFYDIGWLKSSKFDTPIIGLGNITVGGTGKTPHTAYIASIFNTSQKVAILSKGYGRKSNEFKYVTIDSDVKLVGDEPMQAKQNFPDQIVAVDHNRVNGVLNILHDHPKTSVIILDDAFQHRSIKIGFNILLSDYNRPLHSDYIMPIGNLREKRSAIKRADCVIITKCPENLSKQESDTIKEKINFNGNVFFSKIIYDKLIALNESSRIIKFENIKKVVLVTAIAQNKPIINHLKSKDIDYQLVQFRDHYNYKKKDIDRVIDLNKNIEGDSIILTTEKDAQKLKEFEELKSQPVYYLKVSVDFLWNKDKFDKKLNDYVRSNQKNS